MFEKRGFIVNPADTVKGQDRDSRPPRLSEWYADSAEYCLLITSSVRFPD